MNSIIASMRDAQCVFSFATATRLEMVGNMVVVVEGTTKINMVSSADSITEHLTMQIPFLFKMN